MQHVEYAKKEDGNWTWVLVEDDGSVSGQADNNLSSKAECLAVLAAGPLATAGLCTAHEVLIDKLILRRILGSKY